MQPHEEEERIVKEEPNEADNTEMEWQFCQVKGELEQSKVEKKEKENVSEPLISCLEFNDDGQLLAVGDEGGKVTIYKRESVSENTEYNEYAKFQSHDPEMEEIKVVQSEENIKQIRWVNRKHPAHLLLSTNDRIIKLWKTTEKVFQVDGLNLKDDTGTVKDSSSITTLRVPTVKPCPPKVDVSLKRIFASTHQHDVNSISVNSDQETFLSADDLFIYLWKLEVENQNFNMVNIKPAKMHDLTEVITCAEFHPSNCNMYVYSSSKGILRLCDTRVGTMAESQAKVYQETRDTVSTFYAEIVDSMADVKFSHSGRFMISRDFMTIKVWDLNMESKPVETYHVHDYLSKSFGKLYSNECIFDQFKCYWNGSDTAMLTGSYNNIFRIWDRTHNKDYTFQGSMTAEPNTILKPIKVTSTEEEESKIGKEIVIKVDDLDYTQKMFFTAWHPHENIIAAASKHNLFFFKGDYKR